MERDSCPWQPGLQSHSVTGTGGFTTQLTPLQFADEKVLTQDHGLLKAQRHNTECSCIQHLTKCVPSGDRITHIAQHPPSRAGGGAWRIYRNTREANKGRALWEGLHVQPTSYHKEKKGPAWSFLSRGFADPWDPGGLQATVS